MSGVTEPTYAGPILTSVAGNYYYTAPWYPGEYVHLVRNPENPYDPNAIVVLNSRGSQIGHLPRDIAAALAGLMDANQIVLLGRLLCPDDPGFDPELATTRPPMVLWVFEDPVTLPLSGNEESVVSETVDDLRQNLSYEGGQEGMAQAPF
jgi:hypothetical protein